MGMRKIIAWDFDGVLNDNIRDGRFIWADDFEKDLGQSLASFKQSIFFDDFWDIITGKLDLRDRVALWADRVGYAPGADAVLDYWFTRDMHPNDEVLTLVDELRAAGVRHVMTTNNEQRRTAHIVADDAFGPRMEQIFAAGPMGVAKPDADFFLQVTTRLAASPEQMILVDDHADNVAAARDHGWDAFHFTADTRSHLRPFLAEVTA